MAIRQQSVRKRFWVVEAAPAPGLKCRNQSANLSRLRIRGRERERARRLTQSVAGGESSYQRGGTSLSPQRHLTSVTGQRGGRARVAQTNVRGAVVYRRLAKSRDFISKFRFTFVSPFRVWHLRLPSISTYRFEKNFGLAINLMVYQSSFRAVYWRIEKLFNYSAR